MGLSIRILDNRCQNLISKILAAARKSPHPNFLCLTMLFNENEDFANHPSTV